MARKKKKKNTYYRKSIPGKDVYAQVFSKRAYKAAWDKQRKVEAYFGVYDRAYQQAKDAINDEVLDSKAR